MLEAKIIDRGRGPKIAGSRITVFDVLDSLDSGWDFVQIVYRRLTLEAQRQRTDNSKLMTKILDRELPTDIRIVVSDEQTPAPE